MPRLPKEEIAKEQTPEAQAQQPSVVEVEVNLILLNNKLNYVISKLDEIYSVLSKDPRVK